MCIRDRRIPYSDRAIRVTHSEKVGLNCTLSDACDLTLVLLVLPLRQQLALLHVPTQHLLVGADIRSACTGASVCSACDAIGCPYTVGGRCANRAERLNGFVFSMTVSVSSACSFVRAAYLYERTIFATNFHMLRLAIFCMRHPTLFGGKSELVKRPSNLQLKSMPSFGSRAGRSSTPAAR